MKKSIYTILLILFLMIDPHHVTTSGVDISEEMTIETYNRLSEMAKRLEYRRNVNLLNKSIEEEYKLFYNNLDTISRPKFTKRFMINLMCSALESKSLPSISISQAAIETGYGTSNKLKHNIFGIKGKGIRSKTKEFINGKYVVINSEFQFIKSQKHAFDRHFAIIQNYGVKGDNYLDWIETIVSHGYATDPRYSYKLKYIISRYQLDRLDKIQKLNLKLIELHKNDSISRI